MADEIDQACDREQRDRDLCIAAARIIAKSRELQPAGVCYNCHDPLDNGERFCNRDCADDYDNRLNASRRAGRVFA